MAFAYWVSQRIQIHDPEKFKAYADNIICFIDEPILSAFGSSTYVSVSRDEVVAALEETIAAVHADGALAGIHCCGNTEWSILIDAGVDIVNFDAFELWGRAQEHASELEMKIGTGRRTNMFKNSVANLIEKQGGIKSISLYYNSLHKIMNSPLYTNTIEESWNEALHNGDYSVCGFMCAKKHVNFDGFPMGKDEIDFGVIE